MKDDQKVVVNSYGTFLETLKKHEDERKILGLRIKELSDKIKDSIAEMDTKEKLEVIVFIGECYRLGYDVAKANYDNSDFLKDIFDAKKN